MNQGRIFMSERVSKGLMMALAKNKLMDDNLDSSSSSENEEKEETNNGISNKIMMPLNQPRRRLLDDNLDSSSSSDSESESEPELEIWNDVVPGPSTSVQVSESKICNLSEKEKADHHDNENDNVGIDGSSNNIGFKTTREEIATLSSTDSDEEYGGSLCNFDENNLNELEDKKYRPKQSKQSKTKKKTKKSKIQKTGTSSNKDNDKNPNQHCEQQDEIEIKSNVPLSSSPAGRKNSQSKRSANQKPRQYRRDRGDRNVSTTKPAKIPNIPHPHGHVEVKRVTANDAIDILERIKSRLAIDSDNESDNKDNGSGARSARKGGGRGVKDICSVLVIRKKAEYCSD